MREPGKGSPLYFSPETSQASQTGHDRTLDKSHDEGSRDNTDMFSAHSTRGASTSKANTLGVSSADILKAANWSSTSTFCRFYHRPTHSASFGRTVLRRQGTSPCELQTIPYCKTDYVVVVYPEPPKYNYRFLNDSRILMRRMNCMRRRRIHGNNIVSFPPGPWTHRAIYIDNKLHLPATSYIFL